MSALTGPASMLVPQIRRVFALLNTDTAFAITLERGVCAMLVQPGESALLTGDGSPDGLFRIGPGAPVYDFGMVAGAAPGAGDVLGKVVVPRPLLIPSDLAGSAVHVDTAPEADLAQAMTPWPDSISSRLSWVRRPAMAARSDAAFATLQAPGSIGSRRRSGSATSPTPSS